MDNTPIEEVPLEAPIEPEVLGVKPEKKMMKTSTLIIIIVAAVLVLCCCIVAIVVIIGMIPMSSGGQFMEFSRLLRSFTV